MLPLCLHRNPFCSVGGVRRPGASVTAVLLSPTGTIWCLNLKGHPLHSFEGSFVPVSWPRQWLPGASERGGRRVPDSLRVPLGIVIEVRKQS